MLLLIFVNMLFAITYIIISHALKVVHPIWLLAVRMLFAGLVSIVYQFFRDKKLLYIQKKDLFFIFITSLLHMYINFLSETYALKNITPIATSIFYLISPLFSAILDFFYNNKIMHWKQIIIMIIGFILSVSMLIINNKNNISLVDSSSSLTSYILLIISIISSTIAWYRIQYLRNTCHYSLITINGYASLIAGVLFTINIFYLPNVAPPSTLEMPTLLGSGILLALFANIIGYNIYSFLLSSYSITTILFAELLAPCFTAYYEWLFFNIFPHPNNIIFFIFFIILISLFHYYEKK